MSHNSSVPLFWRLRKSRYMLMGTKCHACNTHFFPPRNLCPTCRRKGDVKDHRFSGNGIIETYTIIHVPPGGFEKDAPYAVAIVKMDEGVRISGQVVGNPEDIEIGKRVTAVFRRMYEDGADGLIHYGVKWRIIDSSDSPKQES